MATDGQLQSRPRPVSTGVATTTSFGRRVSDPSDEPSPHEPRKKLAQAALDLELDQHCFSSIDREVLSNAVACAGAAMADPLMSLVDTAFVGRLGLVPLAALGPNGALFNVIYFLCFTPLAVLCTQNMAAANSRGDVEGVGRGFVQAFTAMAGVSAALVVVLVMGTEPVLRLFQTNDEVMPAAKVYCSIRALSLPAALSMAVCQAAFRSLLDLRTPFLVVMASSSANFLLDEVFMFRMGGGIAGCGWASVLSQYIGAGLFFAIIYARRHQFGLPAALAAAPARYSARYGTSLSGLLPRFYGGSAPAPVTPKAAAQQLLQPLVPGAGCVPGVGRGGGGVGRGLGGWLLGRFLYNGSSSGSRGPKAKYSDTGEGSSPSASGTDISEQQSGPASWQQPGQQVVQRQRNALHAHQQLPPLPPQQQGVTSEDDGMLQVQQQQQQQYWGPGLQGDAAAGAPAGAVPVTSGAGSISSTSSTNGALSSSGRVQRVSFTGGAHSSTHSSASGSQASSHGSRGSKHPGLLNGMLPPLASTHGYDSGGEGVPLLRGHSQSLTGHGQSSHQLGVRVAMLVFSLDWRDFSRRFAALTARGLLILSTYTGASVVAARQGTKMMAGHQVVQQQQQLQMSVAWSFLHVGQSMVANLYHTPAGVKAARKLALRIVRWAATLTGGLALATWALQHRLSRIFVSDKEVLALVGSAAVPATLMLGISWNNALEGCLLGADENAYVVKVYPVAVAGCLLQLGHTVVSGSGLTGVWWGLFIYYLGLLLGFANRFWFHRGHL